MNSAWKEIFRIFVLAALISPLAAFAVTITVHPGTRSAIYQMGIVPYYVYGPEISISTDTKGPIIPKMPLVGEGGKFVQFQKQ